MNNFVYIDIETIPAQSETARSRIAAAVKPPGQMKKADTIAEWEKTQKPAAIEEALAKSALTGSYGHICCVGFAFNDEPVQTVSWPVQHNDETEALRYLATFLATENNAPVVVGHNVVQFDIRFLWQRAIVLGVRMPAWFPRNPKPWDRTVFDTMTAFAGDREYIGMDVLADVLGIEGKGDVDGSMVGKMFAEGRHDEIAAYCSRDVERTRLIHKKMMIAFGEGR